MFLFYKAFDLCLIYTLRWYFRQKMPTANEEFSWPWQYNFPPFFTLQPNKETRRKQMDAWCQLVLGYFLSKKQTSVDISSLMTPQCELFNNPKINRKASPQLVQAIFDELHKRGNLEWNDRFVDEDYVFTISSTLIQLNTLGLKRTSVGFCALLELGIRFINWFFDDEFCLRNVFFRDIFSCGSAIPI